MGYSYVQNPATGSYRLCCDTCGEGDGTVRKRNCRYVVLSTTLRSPRGDRTPLNYCYPPALCRGCYAKRGFVKGVHGDACKEGAAKTQAGYDAEQERLEAGDYHVVCAFGDWHELVPEGMVGVEFGGKYWARDNDALFVLVPTPEYPKRGEWLSDYEEVAVEWKKGTAA